MMADLNELTAFAAVARLRSFRQAALERGVSASALGHALRALEERLGVRLLNRTTRSVTPTEAGQQLLARLTPAMREIDDALRDLSTLQDVPERAPSGRAAAAGTHAGRFCRALSARAGGSGDR